MPTAIPTIVCKDAPALAEAVADKFLYLACQTVPGPMTVALSGGGTPQLLYERLAESPYREKAPWPRIEFFFGDERAVPPDHPESNFRMAHRALLSKVPSRYHRAEAEEGKAAEYEELIRKHVPAGSEGIPRFDLVLLGMGSDGHTASLFPSTQALQERKRLVVMNEIPQLNARRMTFTYPLLNSAKKVWILAPGQPKQPIVQEVLRNPAASYPVQGIHPKSGDLLWWLDAQSAKRT